MPEQQLGFSNLLPQSWKHTMSKIVYMSKMTLLLSSSVQPYCFVYCLSLKIALIL